MEALDDNVLNAVMDNIHGIQMEEEEDKTPSGVSDTVEVVIRENKKQKKIRKATMNHICKGNI